MNLIIHDLKEEEWSRISAEYDGWKVVSDNGRIRPCIGCFSCWNKDPGRCAIKDGYENMGYLIHHADQVVVMSRYTYGGFSGFVKNVFDRSLGYVLPQFEVIGGETHHRKRYEENKPFTFVFYGSGLTDREKECARRYVQAVCTNIRGHVKNVIFRQSDNLSGAITPEPAGDNKDVEKHAGKVILLNGSMRNIKGNSARLARRLKGQLAGKPEIVDLKDYLSNMTALAGKLDEAEKIILCIPLYVDGLPSQVIRFLEMYPGKHHGERKKIYVLANMGLYESRQLVNLFSAVSQWCGKAGFSYCGGLGISAGELLGTLMEVIPFRLGPTRKAALGMARLAAAADRGEMIEDIYVEPYHFPRSLYIHIANTSWNKAARKNGIRPADLYRRL